MKLPLLAAALAALLPLTSRSAAIPDRPEQLSFPPLQYDPPKPAEYRVQLASGPVAYVVEDRELPLVNIMILVRTGQYLEPKGKEGLAELTGYLLARGGTKSYTAEALEERLAFLAAQLQSGVGDTQGSVSLNLLSKDLDEGLKILREALTEPRFQENKLTLRKQQMLQEMRMRNDDSGAIEGREAGYLAFGEDFWSNHEPTGDSVQSLTREDVAAFHRQWFAPSNFVVAVSGDFNRAQMTARLETLFGGWPFAAATPPAIPTNTVFASPGVYILDKDVPQGRVSLLLPGILRDNPDYFSVVIMNDILGGGGFTSRIMSRVRSDEGLAYDARSSFPGGIYYPLPFTAGFQTKSRTVAYAVSIVEQELNKMRDGVVSPAELDDSKRGFIERFPRAFATKAQVASTFAMDEFTGRYAREPKFYEQYRDRIRAISAEDVQRVARSYLDVSRLAILVVGKREEIMLGHPNHDVKLTQFGGGRLVDLPLRDPLTLRPPAK